MKGKGKKGMGLNENNLKVKFFRLCYNEAEKEWSLICGWENIHPDSKEQEKC